MVTYWDYLNLPTLLSLQCGLADSEQQLTTGELQFIVVHQVFELCLKLMLADIRAARDLMTRHRQADLPAVVHHLDRIVRTLNLTAAQWDLMEVMSAQEFLAFRDKLAPASAAQSYQFCEFEIVLGCEEALVDGNYPPKKLDHIRRAYGTTSPPNEAFRRIERAREEVTFRSALYDWLARLPITGVAVDATERDAASTFATQYLACVRAKRGQSTVGAAGGSGRAPEGSDDCDPAEQYTFAYDQPEHLRQKYTRLRAAATYIATYPDAEWLAWPHALIEKVLEVEQALVMWRRRHARVVERMIGRRMGTAGSSLDYLNRTASFRVFGDLWALRTHLLARDEAPTLHHEERASVVA